MIILKNGSNWICTPGELLRPDPFGSAKIKDATKQELSETIAVPPEMMMTGIEVNVYNNKFAFMNFREKIGIIIESKAMADAMRQAYELSWIGAKSVEVKWLHKIY